MMAKRMPGPAGLLQVALFLVCFLAVCKGDWLMDEEEDFAAKDMPVADVADSKKLDLVFLVHTSKSINKQKYNYYKQFLRDVVQNANIDSGKVKVGLAIYRKRARLGFNLRKYKTRADLLDAIKNLTAYRSKEGNIAAGFNLIRTRILTDKAGDRPDAPNIVIVLTDATSKADLQVIQKAAQALKDDGAKIFAVGVGLKDVSQLEAVASAPKDVYKASTFVNLGKVKDEIVKQIPALHLKDEPGDETSLSVANSKKADIAIAFHLSQAIKNPDIDKHFVPFLLAILEKANIDGGDVRVSLMNYAKKANIFFNLAKFKTSAEIFAEIKAKVDRKVKTKASSAGSVLSEIRTKIFTKKGGDRDDAPNVIILITDEKNSEDENKYNSETKALKAAGVTIVTLGVEKANADELKSAASDPSAKNAIFVKTYASIATQDVINSVRSTIYALQGAQAPPVQPPIRETTTARLPEPPGVGYDLRREERADIAFVIHFNPRKSAKDYENLISFIQSLVDTADLDGKKVQISLYIDGRGASTYFHNHTTNAGIRTYISRFKQRNFAAQKFSLLESLMGVRSELFQTASGDRADVADALIVITDTNSGQDYRQIDAEKQRLTQAGIQVYSIGVGISDKSEMERVASSVRNVFSYSDYTDLIKSGSALKSEIRALNTRRPSPTTNLDSSHQVNFSHKVYLLLVVIIICILTINIVYR